MNSQTTAETGTDPNVLTIITITFSSINRQFSRRNVRDCYVGLEASQRVAWIAG